MDKFITVILLLCYKSILSLDPCTSYKELNDETMRSDYNSTLSNGLLEPGWYRYMKTQIGAMISSCPNEHSTMCGTKRQIWINGTHPGRNCETEVKVCIKDGSSCCDEANRIRTKNCNDSFVVYNLYQHPLGSRFCFDASTRMFTTNGTNECAGSSTTSTTQSTSAQTTQTIPSSSTVVSSSLSFMASITTNRTSTTTISSTSRSSSSTKSTLNTPKTRIPTFTQTTTFIPTITYKVTKSPTKKFNTSPTKTQSTQSPKKTLIFTLTSTASAGTGSVAVKTTNSFTTHLPTRSSITQILTTTNQSSTNIAANGVNSTPVSSKSIDILTATTPSSRTSTAAATEASPSTKDKPTNVGLIVGACIGSMLVLIIIAACSWKLCFRRNRVSHRLPRPPNIDEDIALKIRPT